MDVLIAGDIVIKAQVKALVDILIESKLTTEKEFDDRTDDILYQILSLAKLI